MANNSNHPCTHGHTFGGAWSRLYTAFHGMRQRCTNPQNPKYPIYGGRGITICKRWDSFENFAADMGPHPGKGWSLDRKDGGKDYCKDNCRWATASQQTANRRITYDIAERNMVLRAIFEKGNRWHKGNSGDLAAVYGLSLNRLCMIVRGATWS